MDLNIGKTKSHDNFLIFTNINNKLLIIIVEAISYNVTKLNFLQMCCCLSDEPVEDSKGRIKTFHPTGRVKFQVDMVSHYLFHHSLVEMLL